MLEQHGLAGTAAADDRRDFTGFEVKIDAFEDRLPTEGLVQVNYFNHQLAVGENLCLQAAQKDLRGEAREKSTSGGVLSQYFGARRLSATKHMSLFSNLLEHDRSHEVIPN